MQSNNKWHLFLIYKDNGEEFRNEMMENYLKENNIDDITGGPYNPQHQGAVEAFNKTIHNFFNIS